MDGRTAAATLGVDPLATRDEIRRAFRARAKLLHPDAGPGGSAERFTALCLAVEVLLPTAPEAGTVPRFDGAYGMVGAAAADGRSTMIDLTDSAARRPRPTPSVAVPPGRTAVAPVRRDARGRSFADHLAAALARA
ncbi:MAG: DnaJ domain-containing protein [Actinomycetota bacterium]